MTDTAPITTAITAMIRGGTTGQALVAAISARYPELTWRDLSEALQVAQAQAEQRAARRH
jgi:uncharacterized protein (DUF433 family)